MPFPSNEKVVRFIQRNPLWMAIKIGLLTLFISVLIYTQWMASDPSKIEEQLTIRQTEIIVQQGSIETIDVDSNLSFNNLVFKSLDTALITVSGSIVQGLEVGEAILVVKSSDGSVSDTVLVRVIPNPEPRITLIVDGTSQTLSEPVSVSTLTVLEREGFVFLGWRLASSDELLDSDFLIEDDTELISVFELAEIEAPEQEPVSDPEPEPEPEVPSVHVVTILNESGVTLTAINVENGKALDASLLPLETELFRGYFEVGQTCETPFDLESSITSSMTLIQGVLNSTSPCIELDEMAFSGSFKVGETITAHLLPQDATVKYAWFTSEDNRDFFPAPQYTKASITLTPDHFRQYLAVNIRGTGDYEGTLKQGTPRIRLNENTVSGPPSVIPVHSVDDFLAINSTAIHIFAAGTSQEVTTRGGPDKNYRLITDVAFTSLGSNPTDSAIINQIYTGTLDGAGYEISQVNISSSGTHLGLFKGLDNATIKNITLAQFNITGDSVIGALAATIEGTSTLENITVTDSTLVSQTTNTANIGGLVGQIIENAQVTFQGVLNDADLMTGGHNIGGLIGFIELGNVTITNSTNSGFVTGGNEVGGFVGVNDDTLVISSSINTGNIEGEDYVGGFVSDNYASLTITSSTNIGLIKGDGYIAGFVTYNSNSGTLDISDSTNSGDVITASSQSYGYGVGGFVVDNYGTIVISNSTNTGDVEGKEWLGGFVSGNYGPLTITNSTNSGLIKGEDTIGGFVADNDSTVVISDSINTGNVEGVEWSGGFVAYNSDSVTITNSMNSGLISGSDDVGGFVAYNDSTVVISDSTNTGIVEGIMYVGGFVSRNYGPLTITNSTNSGVIKGDVYIAGFVVNNNSAVAISDSTNTGNVEGEEFLGGFVSENYDSLTITSSTNSGLIKGEYIIGGLVADNRGTLDILDSTNSGNVEGIDYVGGFVSENYASLTITNSMNSGLIIGSDDVGGFVAYIKRVNSGNTTILDSSNHGTVNGGDRIGGLIGKFDTGSATLINTENHATVTGVNYVGGMIGLVENENILLSNLTVSGLVSGSAHIGGVIGRYDSSSAFINSDFNGQYQAGYITLSGSIHGNNSTQSGILIGTVRDNFDKALGFRDLDLSQVYYSYPGHTPSDNLEYAFIGSGIKSDSATNPQNTLDLDTIRTTTEFYIVPASPGA